jgi:hypothetical protein
MKTWIDETPIPGCQAPERSTMADHDYVARSRALDLHREVMPLCRWLTRDREEIRLVILD